MKQAKRYIVIKVGNRMYAVKDTVLDTLATNHKGERYTATKKQATATALWKNNTDLSASSGDVTE